MFSYDVRLRKTTYSACFKLFQTNVTRFLRKLAVAMPDKGHVYTGLSKTRVTNDFSTVSTDVAVCIRKAAPAVKSAVLLLAKRRHH